MKTPFSIFVIRPYHDQIKKKIFSALEGLGGEFDDRWIVPPETADAKAASHFELASPDVLLCPFHPHRSTSGDDVNGVQVLEHIEKKRGLPQTLPILMPVTQLGKPRCLSMLNRAQLKHKANILVIEQSVYESDELRAFIHTHLETFL